MEQVKAIKNIACFGEAQKDIEGFIVCNFFVIKYLLEMGNHVFHYKGPNAKWDKELLNFPNYHSITISDTNIKSFFYSNFGFLTKIDPTYMFFLMDLIFTPFTARKTKSFLRKEHLKHCFTHLIFLGFPAYFDIQGVKVLSWVQGPPNTEEKCIKNLKGLIIQYCGVFTYIKLRIGYFFKKTILVPFDKYSDLLICPSNWSAQEVIRDGLDPKMVKSIPYSTDIERYSKCKDPLARTKSEYFQLLWLGRCTPRKRLDLLIDALTILFNKRDDIRLKFIGSFTYVKKFENLILHSKFKDRIEVIERIPKAEVKNVLKEIDILVQPSEAENFGSSIAEALSAGIPVVVGKTNGTKDYGGKAVFVFEEYTPESLANKIEEAISQLTTNYQELHKEAQSSAKKYLDPNVVARQFWEVLRDL
ncbi:MAG: glycosyltransferase family 4 protein [Proteobacteria bacterium]|nr:glycosyltransferase family 4 protein [Pseudomonadota bacterium]